MAESDESKSSFIPVVDWLPRYQVAWLRFDVIAGVTLAAYAMPVSLAYAGLAGLPPQTGLYCYLVAGIGYAIFGSSRHLAIGPTSAIALLLGVSLGTFQRRFHPAGSARFGDSIARRCDLCLGVDAAAQRAGAIHLGEHPDWL